MSEGNGEAKPTQGSCKGGHQGRLPSTGMGAHLETPGAGEGLAKPQEYRLLKWVWASFCYRLGFAKSG